MCVITVARMGLKVKVIGYDRDFQSHTSYGYDRHTIFGMLVHIYTISSWMVKGIGQRSILQEKFTVEKTFLAMNVAMYVTSGTEARSTVEQI